MKRTRHGRHAFTLVELLVVIGIIALLISILLPTLNRAKEQANLVACASNLRQIGQLVQIYTAENHGYLPYGCAEMLPGTENAGTYNGWWDTPYWCWADSLQRLSNTRAPGDGGAPLWGPGGQAKYEQNLAPDFGAVFHDYDTAGLPYEARVSDYLANPIILPHTNYLDPRVVGTGGTGCCPIRSIAGIKRSSDTMMIWCGPQNLLNGVTVGYAFYNAGPIAAQLDQGCIMGGTYGFYYPSPAHPYNPSHYAELISIGNVLSPPPPGVSYSYNGFGGQPVKLPLLKWENNDDITTNYGANCQMRFRHMGNTMVNSLFVDGHVESKLIGTVRAMDVSVNPGPPPALQAGM
jgi:prepilin-type N-terminal cleavage/methylation domain-containing protein/prepilin-type processing-associated H-X9-DG protein